MDDLYQKASREAFEALLREHGKDVHFEVVDFIRERLIARGKKDEPATVVAAASILLNVSRVLLQQTVMSPNSVFTEWCQAANEKCAGLPECKVSGALQFPTKGN
jgi:hypothetical protein